MSGNEASAIDRCAPSTRPRRRTPRAVGRTGLRQARRPVQAPAAAPRRPGVHLAGPRTDPSIKSGYTVALAAAGAVVTTRVRRATFRRTTRRPRILHMRNRHCGRDRPAVVRDEQRRHDLLQDRRHGGRDRHERRHDSPVASGFSRKIQGFRRLPAAGDRSPRAGRRPVPEFHPRPNPQSTPRHGMSAPARR